MTFDVKKMELDILEAVHKRGNIGFIHKPDTPAAKFLQKKYPSFEATRQLHAVIEFLIEERYLLHFHAPNKEGGASGAVRGLTPKGFKRLRELQAPRWAWFKENWFPVVVASITASIGVGSIIVDVTCNRGGMGT